MASWDARLLTPGRHYALIAEWPAYVTTELAELSQFESEGGGAGQPDRWQSNLRCGRCRQSMGLLGDGGPAFMTTMGDLTAGVLRHMVMAHDVPLSGAGEDSSGARS
jgi:hypothetical protein